MDALLLAAYCTAISLFTFWLGWVWNGTRQRANGYNQGYVLGFSEGVKLVCNELEPRLSSIRAKLQDATPAPEIEG